MTTDVGTSIGDRAVKDKFYKDVINDAGRQSLFRFQEQCYLMLNWDIVLEGALGEGWRTNQASNPASGNPQEQQQNQRSKNYISITDTTGKNSAYEFSNKLFNKNKGDDIDLLFGLNSAQLSSLVPEVRIFKEYVMPPRKQQGASTYSERKTYAVELPFEETRKDKIDSITNLKRGNAGGVGLKSFTWASEGTNSANKYTFGARLELEFEDLAQLFEVVDVQLPPAPFPGEIQVRYSDLLYPQSKYREDPENEGSFTYNKDYFRIKVICGWNTSPRVRAKNRLLTNKVWELLEKQKTVLYLTMKGHDIDIRPDGTVGLSIEYAAYAETAISDPLKSNILRPGKEWLEKIEIAEQELEKARKNQANAATTATATTTPTAVNTTISPAEQKAIDNLESIRMQSREIAYSRILTGLLTQDPMGFQGTNIVEYKNTGEIGMRYLLADKYFFEKQVLLATNQTVGSSNLDTVTQAHYLNSAARNAFNILNPGLPWPNRQRVLTEADNSSFNTGPQAGDPNVLLDGLANQRPLPGSPGSPGTSLFNRSALSGHPDEGGVRGLVELQSSGEVTPKKQSAYQANAVGDAGEALKPFVDAVADFADTLGPSVPGTTKAGDFIRKLGGEPTGIEAQRNKHERFKRNFRKIYELSPEEIEEFRNRNMFLVPYFYLGDLIDIVMSTMFSKSNVAQANDPEGFLNKNLRVLLGDITFYDYGQLEDSGIVVQTPGRTSGQTRRVYTGKTRQVNIANIPISFRVFMQWFYENIIEPQVQDMDFKTFIDKIINDLVVRAIGGEYRFFAPRQTANMHYKVFSESRKPSREQVFKDADAGVKRGKAAGNTSPTASGWYDPVGLDALSKHPFGGFSSRDLYNKRTADDEVDSYLLIYGSTERPWDLNSRYYEEDKKRGIHHLYFGNEKGLVKDMKFERDDIPGLREANLAAQISENRQPAKIMREKYNVNIQMIGNNIFDLGQKVHITPYSQQGAVGRKALLDIGIGGYFDIHYYENKIESGMFETTIKAQWVARGDGILNIGNKEFRFEKRTAGGGSGAGARQQDVIF